MKWWLMISQIQKKFSAQDILRVQEMNLRSYLTESQASFQLFKHFLSSSFTEFKILKFVKL